MNDIQDGLSDAILSQLFSERPLLTAYLRIHLQQQETAYGWVNAVKEMLTSAKSFTAKDMFMWLSGVYLEGERPSYSVIQTKPTDLVKRHFFEPAVPIQKDVPYFGFGHGPVRSVGGPARFTLSQWKTDKANKKNVWLLENAEHGNASEMINLAKTSMSYDFRGVKWALSHSIQQCLVREPLLAFLLSLSHRFGEPSQFRRAVYEAMQSSLAEQTWSAMSGESLELICFAALQAANGMDYGRRNSLLKPFIVRLCEFVSSFRGDQKVLSSTNRRLFGNWDQRPSLTLRSKPANWTKTVEDAFSDFQNTAKETVMPWLVPACSAAELRKKIANCPSLFATPPSSDEKRSFFTHLGMDEEMVVASLVWFQAPKMTAWTLFAIPWCKGQTNRSVPSSATEWYFEFRGRSDSLTAVQANKVL